MTTRSKVVNTAFAIQDFADENVVFSSHSVCRSIRNHYTKRILNLILNRKKFCGDADAAKQWKTGQLLELFAAPFFTLRSGLPCSQCSVVAFRMEARRPGMISAPILAAEKVRRPASLSEAPVQNTLRTTEKPSVVASSIIVLFYNASAVSVPACFSVTASEYGSISTIFDCALSV